MNTDDIARALRRQAASVKADQLRGPDASNERPNSQSRHTRTSFIVVAAVLATAAIVTAAVLLARPHSAPAQAKASAYVEHGMTFHDNEPQSGEGACSQTGYVEDVRQLRAKAPEIVLGTVSAVRKDLSVLEPPPGPTSDSLGTYIPEVTLLPRILTVTIKQVIAGSARPGDALEVIDTGWTRGGQADDPNWYPLTMSGTVRIEQGETAIFALQMDTDGSYHFTCSGALPVDATGHIAGAKGSEDPLVRQVTGLTVAEFIDKLRQ